MARRHVPLKRRGFSLLEVMVAISLLALVGLMLFNLIPATLMTQVRAQHMLEISNALHTHLERRRCGPFSALDPGTRPLPLLMLQNGTPVSIEETITRLPEGPDLGRRIKLVARWKDRTVARDMTVETIVVKVNR